MDILKYITNLLLDDDLISQEIESRYFYYDVTESSDTSGTFIVLAPIYDEPSVFVSNRYLSESYTIQVDVESYDRETTERITKRIRRVLWDNHLKPTSSQLDKYFDETQRYVMSRRYQGIPKNQYYKGERID